MSATVAEATCRTSRPNGRGRRRSATQGSTRVVTDSSGTIEGTWTYDPYGNLLSSSGTLVNPFGFAGQHTDSESGLHYLRARYYDPAAGEFLQVDPARAETRSPYQYVESDPTNATDPTGLWLNRSGGSVKNFLTVPLGRRVCARRAAADRLGECRGAKPRWGLMMPTGSYFTVCDSNGNTMVFAPDVMGSVTTPHGDTYEYGSCVFGQGPSGSDAEF